MISALIDSAIQCQLQAILEFRSGGDNRCSISFVRQHALDEHWQASRVADKIQPLATGYEQTGLNLQHVFGRHFVQPNRL